MIISPGARRSEPELMDRPDLEDARHHAALRGLARVNLWSRAATPLFRAITNLARDKGLSTIRLLDLASGGGDVPIRLWKMAHRNGLRLDVHGCDVSLRAAEFARRTAKRAGADVRFFTLDALNHRLPEGYDVVTCTLFMHHLREQEAEDLLRRMGEAASHMVAVDDLRRNPLGTALAVVGSRILTRSDVVHVDGLRSVRAAFTIDEAAGLAQRAGLRDCTIRPHWPFRFLLTWRKGL